MSDLEFQRELSPDQLREALSLLDRAASMKPQNLQVGDLSSAEEGDPGADEACATLATQDRLPAVEDLQQRDEAPKSSRRHLLRPWHRGRGDADAVV
jgi:hypothetical protein